MFLGSTTELVCDMTCEWKPLEGEPYVELDYSLPLSDTCQAMIFKRVRTEFMKSTYLLPVTKKKKYRPDAQHRLKLRNLLALFTKIKPYLLSRMLLADVQAWENALQSGNDRDDDLLSVLINRPQCLALSMLPSQRKAAQELSDAKDQEVCQEVESQRLQVRAARFNYLQTALDRNTNILKQVRKVPQLVEQKTHQKIVHARSVQLVQGEAAVAGYSEKFAKVCHQEQPELALAEVVKHREMIATLTCLVAS